MSRRHPSHPRSPTPPPIRDPIVGNDEDSDNDESTHENGDFDWYYNADAGGMILNFGKYRGQRINQTSISYLYWCFRNFRYNHPVLQAFRIYHAGLVEHAKTEYRDFVVPFGWTYKGKTIRQCRDKKWLLWTIRQKVLTDNYTIFFIAVQHWLDNPRHYEVTRDIGELLRRSEYADGIDLLGANEYEDPTLADDVDDGRERDADGEDDDDEPTQSDLDFINDGPVEDGVPSDEEEEFEHAGPSSYIPSGSSETRKKRKTLKRKSRKVRSAESRSELDRDFIVPDDSDEASGSEDYLTSDTELNDESSMRVTRSAAKKMGEAVKGWETPVSPTSSRVRKRGKRSNSVVFCSRNSDGDDDDHVPKSNASGRSDHPIVVSDEEEEDDTLPSFNLPRYDKKTFNRMERTEQSTKEDSDSEVEFVEPPDVRPGPSRGLESPNSGDDEGEDEEEVVSPLKHSRVMVVASPPESEGEKEEDDEEDGDDERREVPITPRSRFLNRKRVLTSDSEADETVVSVVHPPRKKLRVNPKVSSSEIEVESDQDVVMFTSSNRNKISRSMKGKRNAKVLEVNGCTDRPLTPAQVRYIVHHELGPASTPRDHRRGSPYSSPPKSHRSRVTE